MVLLIGDPTQEKDETVSGSIRCDLYIEPKKPGDLIEGRSEDSRTEISKKLKLIE